MIDVSALLAATDMLALASETVRLKKQGTQHYGLCPLHADRSPTLRIDPKKGLWYCPSCQIGGNAIDWLMKTEGMRFRDACADLAKLAGIDAQQAKDAPRPIQAPKAPKFPNDGPGFCHWGGQRLLSADNRPVFIFNDFPGRRKYLAMAEQLPAWDFIWWPAQHSTAADMWLAPIVGRLVRCDLFPGLWECHRACALFDRIYGARRELKTVDPRAEADLLFEVQSHADMLAGLLAGRSSSLAPASAPASALASPTPTRPAKEVTRTPADPGAAVGTERATVISRDAAA